MRVIAGTYRSRPLSAPPGLETRPTSDRLRETLFNILAPRLPGCRFVDLYAGTGAVGIEALSRGADHVFFAENGLAALKCLRANLTALGIRNGYAIEDRGTARLLDRLTRLIEPVDLVFVDPSYGDEREYLATLEFFASAQGSRVLAPAALVIAEHATRAAFQLPLRRGSLVQIRTVRQGDTSLTFFNVDRSGADRQADQPGSG